MNSIKLWLSIPVFAMLAACGDDGHESPVQGPEDDSSSEEIQSSSSGKVSSSSRGNNVSSSESDKKSSSSTNYVCSIYTLSDALSCKCNSSVEGKLSYNYDSNVELVCYHDEELDKWGWITNPSASDEDESSSSTAESSSSEIEIVMAEPCRDDTEDNCEYDTLEDERDGESYKTVVIGDQTWMAENLNLETEGSICNGDDPENCEKYGRLYSWAMAMDSAGVYSKKGKDCGFYQSCSARNPVRGVCPTGWHLPSYGEVEKLIETVGGADIAGKRLKATSSWVNDYNGKDTYGFSALAGGFKYYMEETMRDVGGSAAFWTSDRLTGDTKYAFRLFIQASDDDAGLTLHTVTNQLSVRCLKD